MTPRRSAGFFVASPLMKKYIFLLTALTILLSTGIILAGNFLIPQHIDNMTWALLVYFVLLTLLFHVGLVQTSKGRPQVFIRYYMASTTFKLLLHMGVIVIYAIFNKEDAIRFITSFLVFYIIFTAFEVSVAWKQFRKG
jgi:hypothetical protein